MKIIISDLRVLEELTRTVGRLEKDITILKEKMNVLEKNKSLEKMVCFLV